MVRSCRMLTIFYICDPFDKYKDHLAFQMTPFDQRKTAVKTGPTQTKIATQTATKTVDIEDRIRKITVKTVVKIETMGQTAKKTATTG